MKKVTINKSQIPDKQNIEIYSYDNGFRIVAGCKNFICTHAQFNAVMVHYGNGEYKNALKILGVDVVDYDGNPDVDMIEKFRRPKTIVVDDMQSAMQIRGKKRGRPRKAKV